MSILRIVASPSDVPGGAYIWDDTGKGADLTRVSGAFRLDDVNGSSLHILNPEVVGNVTWYHLRASCDNVYLSDGILMNIRDQQSNYIAQLYMNHNGPIELRMFADNNPQSGEFSLGEHTQYSWDIKVEHSAAEITVSWYVNGGLIHQLTDANTTSNFGKPVSIELRTGDYQNDMSYSEIIIADEDTRGMRLREMRPTSLGTFQEWDGGIGALRDFDLATGLSTDTADRRASFGVTNLKHVSDGDVINRVVAQTYAQRGETGIARFNHFFRFGDGNVTDSTTDHDLDEYGQYFLEEFPLNPRTGAAWVPADLSGIQTGVRSRT
jgi:hypothetical protein